MNILRTFQTAFMTVSLYSAPPSVEPQQVKEADISFVSWNVLTRTRQTPNQIRSHPSFRLSILQHSDIAKLIAHLPISNLQPNETGPGDIRLVIDFKLKTGGTVSFCASQFLFYSGDQKLSAKPESLFNDYFDLNKLSLLQ